MHWVLVAACRIFVVSRGLSSCGAWASECMGSVAAACSLSCSMACVTLVSQPRIQPVFSALQGVLLTTGPPGKSLEVDIESLTIIVLLFPGLPWWLSGKEYACQCMRCGFDSWVRKIPWKRTCQLTPVFLPGKSHGQRSLAGYSSWGCKESDMT